MSKNVWESLKHCVCAYDNRYKHHIQNQSGLLLVVPIGKCEGLLRRLSILRLLPLKLVVFLGIRCKHMGSPAQVNTGGHRALLFFFLNDDSTLDKRAQVHWKMPWESARMLELTLPYDTHHARKSGGRGGGGWGGGGGVRVGGRHTVVDLLGLLHEPKCFCARALSIPKRQRLDVSGFDSRWRAKGGGVLLARLDLPNLEQVNIPVHHNADPVGHSLRAAAVASWEVNPARER